MTHVAEKLSLCTFVVLSFHASINYYHRPANRMVKPLERAKSMERKLGIGETRRVGGRDYGIAQHIVCMTCATRDVGSPDFWSECGRTTFIISQGK
eukprot:5144560-Amphidinium_carterae.1